MKNIAKAICCALFAFCSMAIGQDLIRGKADWLTILSAGAVMILLGASQVLACISYSIDALSAWSERRAAKK